MPVQTPPVTPFPEVNRILPELLAGVRSVLGEQLVGFYLDGSLAYGGFDEDSDIDFVAACEREITSGQFTELQAMHDRLATFDSWFAIQIEGSYLSTHALRRYDPGCSYHPNIERGAGERLKWVQFDASWNIHRWILREHGITLLGPEPRELVDPVTPGDLREAMRPLLEDWLPGLMASPERVGSRGYQSYIVLSLCRILLTLRTGTVGSKRRAMDWALANLDARWRPLIEDAWTGRHNSDGPPEPVMLGRTLEFIRDTILAAGQI